MQVAGKALTRTGDWAGAYAKLCVGNKIDEDESSAELQKKLGKKIEREKKIAEQRAKREPASAE